MTEVKAVEVEEEVKVKVKRMKWNFNKEDETLSLGTLTLNLKESTYGSLSSNIDKYVFLYGIKQACSDAGAGIKDFTLRKEKVEKKFSLFINQDSDFLPQGRKALTAEEKLKVKVKKVEGLILEMINAGMGREMAIAIAGKTFSLSEKELEGIKV